VTVWGLGRGGPSWTVLVLVLSGLVTWAALANSPLGAPATAWSGACLPIAVLAFSRRVWWPALLVAVAGTVSVPHLVTGTDIAPTAVITVGSMIAVLLASLALIGRQRPTAISLESPGDLGRLVVAAVTSGSLMACISAAAVAVTAEPTLGVWDAMAIAGPTQVAWTLLGVSALLRQQSGTSRAGRIELTALWCALVAALVVLLAPGTPVAAIALTIPVIIVAALRGSVRTTTLHLLLTAAWVTFLTVWSLGPFELATPVTVESLATGVVGQGYLVCACLMALPLAVAIGHGSLLRKALQSERDLSEMTLATASCLVLVSDLDGTLLRVNNAATRLLGVDAETILGTPAWNLVPDEHRRSARRMFSAPDGSSLPTTVEGRLVDHAGHERRLLWTTGIVRAPDGSPTHLVLTGLDVTAELNAAGHTEHLLRAPIDTAIVGIDRQGRITLVNSGAEAILGRTAEALVGTPFIRVLSAAELAEWARGFRVKPDFASLLAQAVDAAPRDWHWLGDGTSTLVSMELSRIIDNSGALIGYLCVANDVTETRTRQQLLVDALDKERHVVDRLRELDSTKDHFVTTVSHELRTPVATIVGYTEMLTAGELGELTPQQVKAMDAVNRNGERLVTLVDNLLALAGVTGETIARERARVDLVELAKEAERQAGSLLAGRRLTAIFDFPGRTVSVGGDRRQLGLIISNLLSNSIKFTEDGGEVRCTVRVEDDKAVLEVRDNGLGIPEEEQANLFGRFWRSSTALDRHIQGTGLGLATVQAIVAAHGGTITVESAGHLAGTTVRVHLPLQVESGRQETRPRAERVRRERTGPLRPRRPGLPELTRRSGRAD
jgi:PAS domain S-box-containing protein